MSIPYFPMYPTDFEADTSHLTLLEDGVYNRLLRLCWMTPGCSIPADEEWVMRRLRARTDDEKEAVRTVLSEFFQTQNNRWVNHRLTVEYSKAKAFRDKQSENGKKGGRPCKSLKTNETGERVGKAKKSPPEPEPEPNISIVRFDEFWGVYPHRDGVKRNKKGARQKYVKAVKSGVAEDVLISAAKAAHRDKRVIEGYARDPVTWLNQEGWSDEISAPSNSSQQIEKYRRLAGGK